MLQENKEKESKDKECIEFVNELNEVKISSTAGRGAAYDSDLKASNFLMVFGA